VPQLKRLVDGFPPRRPGFKPGSSHVIMWDLSRTKWCWGRFSPSTSVSPTNLYSTNLSTITITYHLGLVQYASSGLSTKRPSLTPLRIKKKVQRKLNICQCLVARIEEQNRTITIINRSFENEGKFRYFVMVLLRRGRYQAFRKF
jgi:hypothetical protein